MKIILDDTNPKDAQIMKMLGAAVVESAAQAAERSEKPTPDPEPENECEEDETEDVSNPDEVETEDLDSDGVKWDVELHASTQTKTARGRWKKRKGTVKSAPAKPVAETQETPEAEEITFDLYKEEIQEHKGKFGIDRTKEIFEQAFGEGAQPSSVSSHDWGKAVEALRSDKGPVTESVDIDDFC